MSRIKPKSLVADVGLEPPANPTAIHHMEQLEFEDHTQSLIDGSL